MSGHRFRIRLPFVSLLASSALAMAVGPAHGAAPLVEVTTCGQHVPPGAVGFLTADLDCSLSGLDVSVYVGKRGKLDLRGHTVTGGGLSVVACEPVICSPDSCFSKSGNCEVFGGTVTGSEREAIVGGRVTIHDLTIRDNVAYAVLAFTKIAVTNCAITNSPVGLQANNKITIVGSTLQNAQVQAKRVSLTSSSVTGNRTDGVIGMQVRLMNSSVIGNGTYFRCGTENICSDLRTRQRPRVDATSTCGTSRVDITDPPESWGVCTLD